MRSSVTLSDDVVVLRPWSSADAIFLAAVSRDSAIERYNGPAHASVADAIAVIESIEQGWRRFDPRVRRRGPSSRSLMRPSASRLACVESTTGRAQVLPSLATGWLQGREGEGLRLAP